jgi:hypothetical protein
MTPMKKALMALAIVGIVIAAGYFVYVMYVPSDDGGEYIPPEPGNDTDNDGLPDTWEMQYWSNLAQTASGDPDADGFTNLQEYANGTNPTVSDTPDEPSEYPAGWNVVGNPNYIVLSEIHSGTSTGWAVWYQIAPPGSGQSVMQTYNVNAVIPNMQAILSQGKITQIQYDCFLAQWNALGA